MTTGVLLEAGASLKRRDSSGFTALEIAYRCFKLEVVALQSERAR